VKSPQLRIACRIATRNLRLWILLLASASLQAADFDAALLRLNTRSFDHKAAVAAEILATGHHRTKIVLNAFLAGHLYAVKQTDQIVIAAKTEGGYVIADAATGTELGFVKRRAVKKIGVNNALRRVLHALIAQLELHHPDPAARIVAVIAIAIAGDQELRDRLTDLLARESDDRVRDAIESTLALFDLDSPDEGTILAAIERLDSNLSGHVRVKLSELASGALNTAVRAAAQQALTHIEFQVRRFEMLETLIFGLSLGSILFLAAIGLAITFGVMGVINMAHGELIMIGAYTTYTVQQLFPNAIEYSLLIAVPAAFVVSGLVGIVIERGIIRFLYGRPLETLLATFGVSLILQQTVRSIYSPLNRSVITPEWMSGSLELASGLSITYNRLYIFVFALMVFTALYLVLQKTRLGLQVRAVTQNRDTARAMGIRSARVDALTFGLGSGIAGVAGVALSQLTNVGPNLGQAYIVDSFLVVVFGGVGNLWGTLVSGMILGIVNKFLEPHTGAVVAKILVLVFIILFIQRRPRGLFPQRGRAAEG